jgi:Kdo2-lipid IVA lauroyltransferase/acyltransferase
VAARLQSRRNKTVSRFKLARYRLEAAAIATIARLLLLLPRPAVMWLGRCIGWGAYLLRRHDRQVARANLDLVLGDTRTPREKAGMARGAMQRLAMNVLGLLWAPRLTPQRIERLVDFGNQAECMRRADAAGKGVIMLTSHYGDWEMLCLASAARGIPLMMVTEPPPNPLTGELIDRMRRATGNRTLPPRFAVLKLFRTLRAGERVGLMVDVNGRRGRGGVWVDFFGLPVFNGSAAAELALRTGAAVVFGTAHPLPGGRIRMAFRTVDFTPTGDHAADVQALSQKFADCCRDVMLEDPTPWLWTYKRWKRRPTEEQGKYPFYSRYARVV